jgi:hypothetical protein
MWGGPCGAENKWKGYKTVNGKAKTLSILPYFAQLPLPKIKHRSGETAQAAYETLKPP